MAPWLRRAHPARSEDDMEPVLTVRNVEKYYGSRGSVTKAVDDISFTVEKGEFVGVMGASGSGKTTLLNCIATIDRVSAGHIFVDRSNPKKMLSTMRQAEASLTDGVSLVVFPEGARTFTGHLGSFKRGAFQLADDLQLAVVPVTINGSFEVLPRTGKWIHWHRLTLTIHTPIPPKGKGAENIRLTMSEAYAAVESGLPEKYRGKVNDDPRNA